MAQSTSRIAAVAPDVPVVTLGGLSKNYLAPGWRMGWGIVSGEASAVKPYTEGIHKLLRARLSANHPEQYAIKPALEGPQDHLIEVRRKLSARRDITMEACNSIPRMSCVSPRGAFYAFPKIDIPEGDDVWVKELLLRKAHSGSAWFRLRPKARHQALPDRVSAAGRSPENCLRGNRRVHEGPLLGDGFTQ